MPEARLCPLCNFENEPDAVRCEQCGERFSGVGLLTKKKTSAEPWWQSSAAEGQSRLPLPPQVREQAARAEADRARQSAREVAYRISENEAARARRREMAIEEIAEAQESAVVQDSSLSPTEAVEQAARRAARAQARLQERLKELEEAEKRAARANRVAESAAPIAQQETMATECASCGQEIGAQGANFSFCFHCGADRMQTGQTAQTQQTVTPQRVTVQVSPTMQTQQTVSERRVTRQSTVSPGSAAFMSFLVPGIGQLMNGQGAKGVLLLLGLFAALFIFNLPSMGLFLLVGRILAAVDAYRIADRRRSGKFVRDGEWDLG